MKLLGMILLIGAGSAMGFYKAYELKRRISDIILLQNAFRLLETEIYYSLTPVPLAIEQLEGKVSLRIQPFFSQVVQSVVREQLSLYQAWEQSIIVLKRSTCLDIEELDAIHSFGAALGEGTVHEQQKNFLLLQQRLQHALEQAECSRIQQARIWQYMGVCVSLAAALLLC